MIMEREGDRESERETEREERDRGDNEIDRKRGR